jgi:hypothetical protein
MNKIAWLVVICLVCLSATFCTKEEGSEETAAQQDTAARPESTTETAGETAGDDALVGTWEITEWKADDIDQKEMWRVGDLSVEFRADGSVETRLVYDDGDERTSTGTWEMRGNEMEIHITGSGEEGDEPFERTRVFAVDELSDGVVAVHAEIESTGRPIVVTYKARRIP